MRFRDSSSTKKNERFHYWNLTIDRLYGNSKGKSRIRRCFAEWITRMDQLEEMREKEQVGDVETSGSRTSGKGIVSGRYNKIKLPDHAVSESDQCLSSSCSVSTSYPIVCKSLASFSF